MMLKIVYGPLPTDMERIKAREIEVDNNFWEERLCSSDLKRKMQKGADEQ